MAAFSSSGPGGAGWWTPGRLRAEAYHCQSAAAVKRMVGAIVLASICQAEQRRCFGGSRRESHRGEVHRELSHGRKGTLDKIIR